MKEQEAVAMRQKRSDPKVKEQEAETKRQKRSDPKVKQQEAESRRADSNYSTQEALRELKGKQKVCQEPI